MRPRLLLMVIPLIAGIAPAFNAAAIEDEIQVYTDELNERGENGLEFHFNTTPSGRRTPDYAGDLPPYRGLRVTPELSRGLGGNLEAGVYLPMATDADGQLYVGGAKARLKWLPLHGSEEEGGWYFGGNTEVSRVTRKFSESPLGAELRVIGGYRARDWLIGVNPIFGWGLSPGHRGSPDVTLAWKAVHKVAPGIALGGEYYDGIGTLGDRLPREEQDRTLYFVMDFDRKPWVFNLGIGHGLTPASDNWTIKAIFEIPFD